MLHVTLLLLLVVPAVAEPTTEAVARRLVRQLGSESFQERETASKALRSLGEKALPALKHAAASSPDAEVRRRAAKLLKLLASGGADAGD